MKIAIVEDDINMRKSLEIAFEDYKKYEIITFKNAIDALKKIDSTFDLIITDINMPKMDGIEFVNKLDGKYEVIIMTANATLGRAIESIHLGVKDFLLKPFEIDTLIKAIERSSKVQEVTKKVLSKKVEHDDFIASSDALEKIKKMAKKAASSDASIMLLGESGVGKEVFANFIHKNSPRAKKPFIALNMAAIPENLLESELFGFEKGAFTDASEKKIGKFESADGGTIFLDEIGEMPFTLQAKLLRALQEKEIQRLGSSKTIKIDIRVVSATNASITSMIQNNQFREDLYYRLNTIPINIPPLRKRIDEILPIASSALESNIKKYSLEELSFSKEAKEALISYKWPGNIRELLSVVERASILCEDNIITPDDLFLESRGLSSMSNIEKMEKELIIEVLLEMKNDLDASSKKLGMSNENLNEKMKKYNIGE